MKAEGVQHIDRGIHMGLVKITRKAPQRSRSPSRRSRLECNTRCSRQIRPIKDCFKRNFASIRNL